MAQKFLTPIDHSKLESLNFRFQNLSTAPSSPALGQTYIDTDDNVVYFWNGTTWTAMSGGAGLTQEQVEDFVGALIAAGTQTGVTVTYNDGTPSIDFVLSDEYVSDLVGAMFSGNTETGVTVTYQDSDNTIDVVVGVLNSLPAPTGDLSLNSQKITNLANGTAAGDAVNKGQLDAAVNGLDFKASVRVATAAAGTLATSFENGDTVDGVVLATGDRILLKDQATGADNGIYVVAASGAPARATDADASAEVTAGLAVFVSEGTTNGNTVWALTTDDAITLGSTALVFTQVSGLGQITAGAALTKTGNTLDVAVDGSTIEVSGDALRVKDGGITDAKLASTFVKKYAAAITGGATSEVITHNLGTRDVHVVLRNDAAPYEQVIVDNEATSTNTVTIRAAANLPAGYRVIVTG